jgi:hypothetical protein
MLCNVMCAIRLALQLYIRMCKSSVSVKHAACTSGLETSLITHRSISKSKLHALPMCVFITLLSKKPKWAYEITSLSVCVPPTNNF